MVRLHLLGFTHDLKGVVFSQRRGGKTATFWIPIDATFLDAIAKLERARSEAAQASKAGKKKGKSRTRPELEEPRERVILPAVGRSQSTSRLGPSDIQQMLREGRTVKSVVEASKATQAWVERLQEPVLAERAGVIRLAQRATMSRPRLGRSGLPVGEAVQRNLEERRATPDTIEGLDEAWDARALHSGLWRVWLRFDHRGKRRNAEWEFRKSTREVRPRNRLGAQLGWWPPEPGAEPEPEAAAAPELEDQAAEQPEAAARPRRPRRRASGKRSGRRAAQKARPRARSAKRPPGRKSAAKPARRRRMRRKALPRSSARRKP